MLNFKTISKIFFAFLDDMSITPKSKKGINYLIRLNIETNRKLWNLEDLVRMAELSPEHIAVTKQEIDRNNQIRNDSIR